MQRMWQVPADINRRGWTLWADSVVEEVRGARTIGGRCAVRVVAWEQHGLGDELSGLPISLVRHMNLGRVTVLRTDDLIPLHRTGPLWTCGHGVAGGEPWTCPACSVLAGAFGLCGQALIPGLPRRLFYFEEAVRLWGEAAGNQFARLAIERWNAHLAGQTWSEFCADRAADDAEGFTETADVAR